MNLDFFCGSYPKMRNSRHVSLAAFAVLVLMLQAVSVAIVTILGGLWIAYSLLTVDGIKPS